jgi:osmotically-inducible protein OsmY
MGSEMNSESTTNANETADVAKKRICCQPRLAFQRIWCEHDGGRLFLKGQVPSFYLKQLAQEAIAGMEGVVQVVNEIEVVW